MVAMFWKIRCVVAWTFRVLAIIASSMVFLVYAWIWKSGNWDKFTANLSLPALLAIPTSIVVVFLLIELTGRVLSWTSVYEKLPRFADGT